MLPGTAGKAYRLFECNESSVGGHPTTIPGVSDSETTPTCGGHRARGRRWLALVESSIGAADGSPEVGIEACHRGQGSVPGDGITGAEIRHDPSSGR